MKQGLRLLRQPQEVYWNREKLAHGNRKCPEKRETLVQGDLCKRDVSRAAAQEVRACLMGNAAWIFPARKIHRNGPDSSVSRVDTSELSQAEPK